PAALDGKRALVRVDFNVPFKNGAVTDDTRIRAAAPTIAYLREKGARVVLLSHFGRPKGPDPKSSLKQIVRDVERVLGTPVEFIPDPATGVPATRRLPRGGVALVENTRFWPGEEANDPAFAQMLAALGDFYVNDAFGSAHRAHASTEAVARLLRPAVTGFLMEKELRYLGEALDQPKRPFVAVLGGAKISGKIDVIEALLPKVDEILVGGAMANTFFLAIGFQVGGSRPGSAAPQRSWGAETRPRPWPGSKTSSATCRPAVVRRSSSSRANPSRGSPPWRTREAAAVRRQLEDAPRPGRHPGLPQGLSRSLQPARRPRRLVLPARRVGRSRRTGGARAHRSAGGRTGHLLGAQGRIHRRRFRRARPPGRRARHPHRALGAPSRVR